MGQPLLFSLIDKAVFDYHMIQPGDRILVGASGGKDSTALVEYFAQRMRRPDGDFMFTALTLETDISGPVPVHIRELFNSWQVDSKTEKISVLERIRSGEHMNCWWCSTQRRKELLDYALKNGYNKLALGHHLDDILETLLMNMLTKSELSTMPPVLRYKKYPVTVIRPLCYVSVDTIRAHAEQQQYLGFTCTCTYQNNSGRKEARARLEALTGGDDTLKEHLFDSLKNIQKEYLP
jgi:tRNA 2-thiocytidine biosynthesis protein TtcA